MKTLYVGDVHARQEDLDDCQKLLDLVYSVACNTQPDRIVFLGDQHHNHGIVHLDVIGFWRKNLLRLTEPEARTWDVCLLVGNHDMSGDLSSPNHAIMAYQSMASVEVVDRPCVSNGLLYLPYQVPESFVNACQASPVNTVVCHQEFNGAEYENGFYSSVGVDPKSIPQNLVISGHIHTGQRFDKVWYLGSPRWLTVGDANQDRHIYLVGHNPDGSVTSTISIPTGDVCRRMWALVDDCDSPLDQSILNTKDRYVVDVVGPQTWIEERRPLWVGRARVRTKRTDQQIIRLKESEGIEKALAKFAGQFIPPHGTPSEVLVEMVNKRLMEGV